MSDIEKEIHCNYFSRLYYFAFRYVNDQDKTQDIVASSFIQLFDSRMPDNEKGIRDFLFGAVQMQCENYYTETLGIPAPDPNDFFNTRVDAELLFRLYNEKNKNSI